MFPENEEWRKGVSHSTNEEWCTLGLSVAHPVLNNGVSSRSFPSEGDPPSHSTPQCATVSVRLRTEDDITRREPRGLLGL